MEPAPTASCDAISRVMAQPMTNIHFCRHWNLSYLKYESLWHVRSNVKLDMDPGCPSKPPHDLFACHNHLVSNPKMLQFIHKSALAGSPAQHLLINSRIGPFSTLLGFQYGLLTTISAALSISSSFIPNSFSPLFTCNFSKSTFSPLVASPLLSGSTDA